MNDFTESKFAVGKRKIKGWFSDKYNKVKDFYHEHPTEAICIGTAIIGVAGSIAKGAIRGHNRREDKKLKTEYIYDRSHGHYIKLRREPNQREWAEIDSRKDAGESLNDIVMDMRLL